MRFSALIDSVFSAGPPSLGLEKRPGTLSAAAVREAVASLAEDPSLKRHPDRDGLILLEGIALLWHDHWEAAHEIAQAREGQADFDLLHAMVHRREGDYPNANYWFAGAGKHPCYPMIGIFSGSRVAGSLPAEFFSPGWSPGAFVSAVKRQAGKPGPERETLRLIQAAESQALAEWILQNR